MNLVDIVILAVIALSGLFALFRGFVRELLSVVGWVGAAFATLYLFKYATPWARKFIAIPWLADGVAGVVIFVVALVVLSTLSHAIASRVGQSHFSALDKSLGLVFGLVRGAVLVCLAYLALGHLVDSPDQYPTMVRAARTMPLVERGARMIEVLIPTNVRLTGAQALDEAQTKAQRGLAAQRALEQLVQPAPKVNAPKEQEGYKADERKEMERVIETNQ